jgi:hypothetical protein
MMETAQGGEGVVQLSNCSFWGHGERVALLEGKGVANLSQCNFCDWDHSKKGVPAIEVGGGSVTVQGSTFWKDRKSILLKDGVTSAIVTGNLFNGEPRIENRSSAEPQVGFNASM